MRTIVWFRGKDLRLSNHAPLVEALRGGGEVVPLFVLDPYFFAPERARKIAHRMQFLLGSLAALSANLAHKGSRLVVVAGRSVDVVPAVARAVGADRVLAHRWVEPFARERDRRVRESLGDRFTLFEGETLVTPGTVRSQTGGVYAVFSAFARAVRPRLTNVTIAGTPKKLSVVPALGLDERPLPTLDELGLTANPRLPEAGERAARKRLSQFVERHLGRYRDERDRMDHEGTSRLSQDLKFGTLSIAEVWSAAAAALAEATGPQERTAIDTFMNELLWREFAYHTLWDRPEVLTAPFRQDFVGFPWSNDPARFAAFCEGRTGYPVVDAAARQLLACGWVHNRARMIAASFLTKHLDVSYTWGERHYLEQLVDGDWAQNNLGWQWSAGCGCDAQPYFRVFNPMSQGEKFDPDGHYVRTWVPELARMPAAHIHAPWLAPTDVLAAAGVRLGRDYPLPIVKHEEARAGFLARAKAHLGKN